METVESTPTTREPWNKGKLVGQKTPFKLKEIWARYFGIEVDDALEMAQQTGRCRMRVNQIARLALHIRSRSFWQKIHVGRPEPSARFMATFSRSAMSVRGSLLQAGRAAISRIAIDLPQRSKPYDLCHLGIGPASPMQFSEPVLTLANCESHPASARRGEATKPTTTRAGQIWLCTEVRESFKSLR